MEKIEEKWVMPVDRPHNICFDKVLDTAADCDVAIRKIYAAEKTGAGLIACIGFSTADDIDIAYPLSAEELIDCCAKGCYIEQSGNGLTVCVKPFQWGMMAIDDTTSCAYAVFQILDMSTTNPSTTETTATATAITTTIYSSELVAVVEASGTDRK